MLAMLALSFTSCETEDDNIARRLDGIWTGTVAQSYSSWRGYTTYYQNIEIQFNKAPNFCAEGDGVEYDFDGKSYIENYFRFYVRNRRIYIDYEYGQDVVILEDYDSTATSSMVPSMLGAIPHTVLTTLSIGR